MDNNNISFKEEAGYRLSSSQKSLWILSQLDGASRTYNLSNTFLIEGSLEIDVLRKSYMHLINRYEILRTIFKLNSDGEVRQYICPQEQFSSDIIYVDIRHEIDKEQRIRELINNEAITLFNLEKGPLIRTLLIQVNEEQWIFNFTMHHIISDAWSLSILLREFLLLYNSIIRKESNPLPPLRIQYKDYAEWQQDLLNSQALSLDEEYWQKQFSGDLPILNLHTDKKRPSTKTYNGGQVSYIITPDLAKGIKDLSKKERGTMFMGLLTLVNILLYKYTNQLDIILGTTLAGRRDLDLESQIGFFVNTLALRTTFKKEHSFKEIFENVKNVTLSAYEHQDYPFDELVDKLNLKKDFSRTALFDVLVVLQNTDKVNLSKTSIGDIKLSKYHDAGNYLISKFDLTFEFEEKSDGLSLVLEYNSDLYDIATIQRLKDNFFFLLEMIIANPDKPINQIDYLSESQKQTILKKFNDSDKSYPSDKTLIELFEKQAERTPDDVAIIFDNTTLSFKQLNESSNQIGHYLRSVHGVKRGDFVAIKSERNEDMAVMLLGILKSGGVYLPIDEEFPEERVAYIFSDSGCEIFITDDEIAKIKQKKENYSKENLSIINDAEDIVYLIYTSGSTGNPKGVLIKNKGIVNQVYSKIDVLQLNHREVMCHNSKINFVGGTWQLWAPLLTGTKLVICNKEELININKLLDKVALYNIKILEIIPSQLNEYIYYSSEELKMQNISDLILTGEKLNTYYLSKLLHHNKHLSVWNGYGQTECSNDTTFYKIPTEINLDKVLIGKPIQNTRHYILDQDLNSVPIGVIGEIHTSGHGLAAGYLNNKVLTDEKFIPNPFLRGEKMYRTGDLGKWLEDGTIEYIGRTDHQIKVRGYRIEPSEIEQALEEIEEINKAVVLTKAIERDDFVIIAYYISNNNLNSSEIRLRLSKKLPTYMLPAYYVQVDNFPSTSNGKLDRKLLLTIDDSVIADSDNYIAPVTEIEQELVQIWSEVLHLDVNKIGVKSNFFELGGHSIKVTRLLTFVQKKFHTSIAIKEFFDNPTISGLISKISSVDKIKVAPIKNIAPQEHYALSYAQKRVWILSQFEEDSISYNLPHGILIKGAFDLNLCTQAADILTQRHESLRTVFITVNGEPRQKILDRMGIYFEYLDYSHLIEDQKDEKIKEEYKRVSELPFDLENGPLIRIAILKLSETQNYLFLNLHHIISDGWSHGIILNEFSQVYNALYNCQPVKLPELNVTYKDYAAWHNSLIDEGKFDSMEQYWLTKFQDKPNGIDMPLDNQREIVQTFNGGSVSFLLDNEDSSRLKDLCEKMNITANMYFLATLGILLYKYSGQKDIIIGSPIAGRKNDDLFGVIGFFVNTIVCRYFIDPNLGFNELLQLVKLESLKSYDNQDYPFDYFIDKLSLARDLTQSPLFNVMLAYNNTNSSDPNIKLQNAEIFSLPVTLNEDVNISKFDLIFFVNDYNKDQLSVTIEYNSDLFNRSTIERMSKNYSTLIKSTIKEPHSTISEISIIDSDEKNKLLLQFNDTSSSFEDFTVQELFERQVQLTPGKTALVFNREEITYNDLNERSNQLAHFLRERFSIKSNKTVAISLDRSFSMIISILAVIKSGGTYLAIDPSYPKDRIKHMLNDSECELVLVDSGKEKLLEDFKGVIINYDEIKFSLELFSKDNTSVVNNMKDALYLMYTSGSTGTPNGAILSHGLLSNLIQWHNNRSNIDPSLRCLQFTSINFCVSFQEIMSTLCYGGELYLIGEIERQDVQYLSKFLEVNEIQNLYLPFSYLNFLFSEFNDFSSNFKSSLVNIITAGEQLKISKSLKEFLEKQPQLRLHNHYGSSELHVVTSYILDHELLNNNQLPPVGKPLSNTKIFILDEFDNPVPLGAWGEICVLGSYEFIGYVNNETLTEKKLFNPLFFKNNGRLYRSGDIGRYKQDGRIELKGRKDSQVKIRGFRVELGEIESRILSIKGVQNCVVTVRLDDNGQKFLVAYVAIDKINIELVYDILSNCLPQYMVPKLVELQKIPLMPNGKVDHEKLPRPIFDANKSQYVPPKNETEKELIKIWKIILEVDEIGIKDNFFEIGGDSLKAVRSVSAIYKTFGVKLDLINVFKTPTVEKLSVIIEGSERDLFSSIKAVDLTDNYPLSSAQRRLWFVCQFEEGNIAYNMPGIYMFKGNLDYNALTFAFNVLMTRHESLRTVFKEDANGEIKQFILSVDEVDFLIPLTDLRKDTNKSYTLNQYISRDLYEAFDLSKAPLLRSNLYCVENDKWIFSYTMHHLIGDGWSMGNLINELLLIYKSYLNKEVALLSNLTIQYKDFAAWQQQQLLSDSFSIHKKYWLEQFEGDIPVLNLPSNKIRPKVKTYSGGVINKTINSQLTKGLKLAVQKEGATLFMGLMSLVKILLYRYTQQNDIIIGTPVAGREHIDLENQIGLYVNMIALRTKIDIGSSFIELLRNVQASSVKAFKHQSYPLDELVDDLNLKRDISRSVLFDVMLVLQNTKLNDKSNLQSLIDLEVSTYEYTDINKSKYDLTFNFSEENDEIKLCLEYNSDVYEVELLEQFSQHLIQLLENILVSPLIAIEELKYLNQKEIFQLTNQFNNTFFDYQKEKNFVTLFEQRVNCDSNKTALVFEGEEISYEELNKKSNQLAYFLKHKYNISDPDLVAIKLDRNQWTIITILATLKLGAGYLPIDPGFPEDRISYIISDSRCKVVIDNDSIESFKREYSFYNETNLGVNTSVDSIAYVLYTSGSTGKPKGIKVSYRNMLNLFAGMNDIFGEERGVMLALTNVVFDISVIELLWTLTLGYKIVLQKNATDIFSSQPKNKSEDYSVFGNLTYHKVTHLQSTPSLISILNTFLTEIKPEVFLKKILIGGEKLSLSLTRELYKNLGNKIDIYNMYGPTETTVYSTYYKVGYDAKKMLIGKPIVNTEVYILDRHMKLMPIGVDGEIYIGGDGVSKGYLNEALTKERFVENPYCPGKLVYKTGDSAKWTDDGMIEYIGRLDSQVKIFGNRVELEEVQNTLLENKAIQNVIVIDKDDENGEKFLVAYIVAKENLDIEDLRLGLANRLSDYMIPKYFILIDSFPLTASGKINRNALPDPYEGEDYEKYFPPRSQKERDFVIVWEEILNRDNIGIRDNFFEIGGNSLKLIKMLNTLNLRHSLTLKVQDIFSNPTIEHLANIGRSDSSGLVRLTSSNVNDGPTIYFIPPISGNSIMYKALAEKLEDDFTCYGLQYPGLEEKAMSYSIEQIAAGFADQIERYQKDDNFIVLGYSMGALISFEVLKILEKKFNPKALLIVDRKIKIDNASIEIMQEDIKKVLMNHDLELTDSIGSSHDFEGFLFNNIRLLNKYKQHGKIKTDIYAFESTDNTSKTEMNQWQNFSEGNFKLTYLRGSHWEAISEVNYIHFVDIIKSFCPETKESVE